MRPARIETIEAVLAKFQSGDDRDIAMAFCQLIRGKPDQAWCEQSITSWCDMPKAIRIYLKEN